MLGKLNVNNKTVEYYKFGTGKKNFVMIPGIGLTNAVLMGEAVEKAYANFKNDFTIYLIERADNLKENDDIDSIALDYIAVIKELNLNDIYLFAVSLGGMIAQSIAHKAPNLIKKMMLVSTNTGRNNNDLLEANIWLNYAEHKKLDLLTKEMLYRIYSKKVADSILDVSLKTAQSLSEDDINRFAIQLKAVLNFNSVNYLKDIDIPTLIVAAKGDKVFDYHEAIYLHENIKNSELYLYDENWPHAVYDEAPDFRDRIYNYFMKK